MRMILEVFHCKPPVFRREVLVKIEVHASETSIKHLIARGEDSIDEAKQIYYHILFPDNMPRKEAEIDPV